MNEWIVTRVLGEDLVQAQTSEIHPSGALVFTKNGKMAVSYAPGEWLRCTIKTEAPLGYR